MPKPRRTVLKVGSRLLTGGGTELDRERMRRFVEPVARHRETETVLVSSGAVAAGYAALRMAGPPRTIPERQAAAAVGQTLLMRIWAELFAERGLGVGQVLLTHDAVLDRRRYVNARNAFGELFRAGVIPVVNENDTVSVEEIRVGDNDNLAAYTAALVDADLLVLLTDVAGVYDRDPRTDASARIFERADSAEALRPYVYARCGEGSVGGMATKLDAAEKAARYGIPTLIASGMSAQAVESIYAGRPIGTWIEGAASPLPAIRQWMAMQQRVGGALLIDDGAAKALCAGGTSLLPRGVLGVQGRFDRGDVVAILDPRGVERARGIVAYDDRELERIRGRHSSEIEDVLGYRGTEEVIRADKLVILRRT